MTGSSRIGTAGRPPPSSRLRTGQVLATPGTQAAMGLSSLGAAATVTHRPVTQQGLSGMKSSHGGRGRQVQDVNYFLGEIRKRNAEIASESRRLHEEVDQRMADATNYSNLEKRYQDLFKEVRNLEGQLADYNLAKDKYATSTDPMEIREYMMQIEEKNRMEAAEQDRLFLMKQEKEKLVAEVEAQIQQLHSDAERRINQLEPGKLERYRKLLEESQGAQKEASDRQGEVDQLNARIREAEGALKESGYRDEYNRLEGRERSLQRELEGLRSDLKIAGSDPKDAHAKLLEKVKEQKRRTRECESDIGAAREEIASMRRHLDELASGAGDRGSDGASEKYEKMLERDKLMSDFIEGFDAKRDDLQQKQRVAQDTIVALLQHISQGLESKSSLPSEQRLQDMKDEATFKERQLKGSTRTLQDLQGHKRRAEQELAKLQNLDVNINNELQELASNMDKWREEMAAFEDLDGLRSSAADTMAYLEDMRERHLRRRDSIRQQVSALSRSHEDVKRQLSRSETLSDLEALEKRLKFHEQNIFNLKEWTEERGRATDYVAVKESVMKITEALNKQHQLL